MSETEQTEYAKSWSESEKMECVQLFDAVSNMMKPHSDAVRENVVVNLASHLILDAVDSPQDAMAVMIELSGMIGKAVFATLENDPSFETVGELLKRARPQ